MSGVIKKLKGEALFEIRSCIEAEIDALSDRVEGLRRQLNRYLAAYEQGVVTQTADELGIPVEGGLRAAQDAQALRSQISQVVAEAKAATAADMTDAKLLLREFDTLDLDSMDDELFRTYAEEYAARARAIQKRVGERGRHAPENCVIRALTRCSCERGIRDVFGLARHHRDDWDGRAEKARRDRATLEAELDDRQLVDAVTPRLPLLTQLSAVRPIVLFGGEALPEKLERLRDRTGLVLEWLPGRDARVLTARIRSGAVTAVVMVEGFLAHKNSDLVRTALRTHRVPFAFAGRGGLASVERALETLEQQLVAP